MNFEITAGGDDIDELEPLWLQMLSHHRGLVSRETPVHTDEQSWARTRRAYAEWLANDTGILLIARDLASHRSLGYAICRLVPGDGRTFDLGAIRGDVDSLVVDAQARGQGIGTALLDALRDNLVDRGVSFWSIGVLARNAEAVKLYERVGFRPWTAELIASTHRS
jgi:ribosomal protein S18 acetylase RimI-like enzyme